MIPAKYERRNMTEILYQLRITDILTVVLTIVDPIPGTASRDLTDS